MTNAKSTEKPAARLRVEAANAAKQRVVVEHREEYDAYYIEELHARGLEPRRTGQVAALQAEIERLKAELQEQKK